ncbi:MAG: hypothetical protein WAM58_12180 [Candidatus Acidiferrum sp.]
MAVTTGIAPDMYRISVFARRGNLQFNHFLVKDDEPLLFHTGLRGMHAEIREAVPKLKITVSNTATLLAYKVSRTVTLFPTCLYKLLD